MKKLIYSIIILFLISVSGEAAVRNTYDFLNIPESGFTEIASKSGSATADGIVSVFGNPAGFGGIQSRSVLFSDTENLGDTRKVSLFFGQPLDPVNFVIGVKYFYLKDPIISEGRTIVYDHYAVNLLLARELPFVKGLRIGLKADYVESRIASMRSSLVLFGAGAEYGLSLPVLAGIGSQENFTMGLSLHNIGLAFDDYNTSEDIPARISAGIRYGFINTGSVSAKVFGNYIYQFISDDIPAAGMTLTLFSLVDLSAGYRFNNDLNPLSLGIGFQYRAEEAGYRFNYTLMPISDLEDVHLVSFMVQL
ncbi:MAG: hypothetical protein KKH98_00235 [Spirochaetes bacterium]|nr:hypothetical protein [Spirochaetota bacterium]